MWRTLTRNEWDYILYGRPHCNNLYSIGCVDDINELTMKLLFAQIKQSLNALVVRFPASFEQLRR